MQKLKAYTFVSLNGNDWSLQFHQHFQEKEREEKKTKNKGKQLLQPPNAVAAKAQKLTLKRFS